MPPPGNKEELADIKWADAGHGGRPPLRKPLLAGEWQPGMPVHWTEEGWGTRIRHIALRLVSVLQLVVGVGYIQYRARRTVGRYDSSPQLMFVL
jgi:hypothetical protein